MRALTFLKLPFNHLEGWKELQASFHSFTSVGGVTHVALAASNDLLCGHPLRRCIYGGLC